MSTITITSKQPILKFNLIGCPNCANPLIDSLNEFETELIVKSVKCTVCDYIGKRNGFVLLQPNEYHISSAKSILQTV